MGANEKQGTRLTFKVIDNGHGIYRATMNADADATVKFRFARGTGKHRVQILKRGKVVRTFVLHMGR